MADSPATGHFGHRGSHRLCTAAEFSAVFAYRRVLRGERFDLHYRPNGGEQPRLGFVVAKKLARRAVLRNLIKRIGREAFRHACAGLPACDLVLRLARPIPAADAEWRRNCRREIDALLARLGAETR